MPGKRDIDDVNGIVIGGAFVDWQVVYDGRTQTGKFYADTTEQAKQAALWAIEALQAEFCGAPCYLYQDNAAWAIRIWEW